MSSVAKLVYPQSFFDHLARLEFQCKLYWPKLLSSHDGKGKENLIRVFQKAVDEISNAIESLPALQSLYVLSEVADFTEALSILTLAYKEQAAGLQIKICAIRDKALYEKQSQNDADKKAKTNMTNKESAWEDFYDQGKYNDALDFIILMIRPKHVATHLYTLAAKLIDKSEYNAALLVIKEMRKCKIGEKSIDLFIEIFSKEKQEIIHKHINEFGKESDRKNESASIAAAPRNLVPVEGSIRGSVAASPLSETEKVAKLYPNASKYLNVAVEAMGIGTLGVFLKRSPVLDNSTNRIIPLMLVGWILAGADSKQFPEICTIEGLKHPVEELSKLCSAHMLTGAQLGKIIVGMPDPASAVSLQVATSISTFRNNSSLPIDAIPVLLASAVRPRPAPSASASVSASKPVGASASIQAERPRMLISDPVVHFRLVKHEKFNVHVYELVNIEMFEEAFELIKKIPNRFSHHETIRKYVEITSIIAKRAMDKGNLNLALRASVFANKDSLYKLLKNNEVKVVVAELQKIVLSKDQWDRKTAINLLAFFPKQLLSLSESILSDCRIFYDTESRFSLINRVTYEKDVAMIHNTVNLLLQPMINLEIKPKPEKVERKVVKDTSQKQ